MVNNNFVDEVQMYKYLSFLTFLFLLSKKARNTYAWGQFST